MTFDHDHHGGRSSTRITLSGVVDRATVGGVERAVRDGLRTGPRVDVDLRDVEGWEDDALRRVAECARLGVGVEFLVAGKRRVPGVPG